MRAPSITVSVAKRHVPVRDATIHYHGSTKAEEAENVYYAPAHYEIQATQRTTDCQPRLRISQPEHLPGCAPDCNVAHGRPFLRLECPETMALGALAEIDIGCEPEEMAIDGNCGDDENAAWIREQLASGNEWAWCQVVVRARFAGFEARTYLGGCSYRSRADFERPGGYLDQMLDEVLTELAQAIEHGAKRLRALGNVGSDILARD
jgi:hypothetical protein